MTSKGEPRLSAAASWAVLAASFGLSASTWIALARLAGFTDSVSVAGVVTVALAWLMPVCVDGYVVVALVLWMAPVPARVARFARANTYGAAGVGVAAQSAYHALSVWSSTGVLWRAVLAAVVGAIPPAVAALAVHMRALIRRESRSGTPAPPATTTTMPAAAPLDPEVAELCAMVRGQARAARTRMLLPPAVTVAHLGASRPVVHAMAAKPATDATAPAVGPDAAADTRPVHPPTFAQVTTPVKVDASADTSPPASPPRQRGKATPKRSFAATQRAAAAMDADGMTVPQIAVALGITEASARRALRPVPVGRSDGVTR